MARIRTNKSHAKSKKLNTSIYQIHVKGPERNETLIELFAHVKNRLLHGEPLVKADKFGNVVRATGALPSKRPNAVQLTVVKYNSRRTGLAWDIDRDVLVSDQKRVNAQRTELIIYPDEHVAVLVHRTLGPNPSQVSFYLKSLFALSASELEIDCTIDVMPLKVKGMVKRLMKWKVIKRFEIEVYRPNPDGSFKAKRLKDLVRTTGADKARLAVTANVESGIKKIGIKELINEGDRLAELGQARVTADGLNEESHKEMIDSDREKVAKHPVIVSEDVADQQLSTLVYDTLKKWFVNT